MIVFLEENPDALSMGPYSSVGSACPARIPHPHPDTHSACFIHPSLSGLLTFSSMHQDSQFLPLNVPPRYLHVSLSGYSDPLLLLLREGFSGHNPYLCLVQVTFPTHVDPTLKIGLYCWDWWCHTCTKRMWMDLLLTYCDFLGRGGQGAHAGQKLTWDSRGKRPVQLLLY